MNSSIDNPVASPVRMRSTAESMAAGWRLRSQSKWDEAAQICRVVLADQPNHGEAWHLLGLLFRDRGDFSQAVAHLQQAIAVDPLQPLHHNNLAVVLNDMHHYPKAAEYLRKALDIDPGYTDAKCNLGLSHFHQNHLEQAASCFNEILSANPDHVAALANLGMTRLSQQKYDQAITAYERAVAIDTGHPEWHGNLGAACMRMAQYAQAVQCFRRAHALAPEKSDYLVHLGIALRAAGDLPGSIKTLESAIAIDPDQTAALANLVVNLEYTCQWDRLEQLYPRLDRSTRRCMSLGHIPDEDPMLNIRRSSDVALNRTVAGAWSRKHQQNALRVMPPYAHHGRRNSDGRITIGYLSYDFRNHPVAHQLFPMFQKHDRTRFRVIAFSMGPDDGSRFRKAIQAGCDDFIDISDLGLAETARLIKDRRIDILVDLMGHSHHNRMGVLALHCAPVQVSYLGFLSTTGADFIDYVVTDRVVTPKAHNSLYSEKTLRMPHCYQMNHTLINDERPKTSRGQWGLPESDFVYCSFNNAYKIDRRLFDAWMDILRQTSKSVLWLFMPHQQAIEQMQSRAGQLGVDPRRIIFADKVSMEDHLNRLVLADLALDTVRYNGGATTANALGVGLPVITVLGGHWVSRMTASQLIAMGLSDLVFNDLASYVRSAALLGNNPDAYQAVRNRVMQNRETCPLFDADRFVRNLEQGLQRIWQRYTDGLAPCDIDLPRTAKDTP